MTNIKRRLHSLLEPGEAGDWASKAVDRALIALIVVNVLVVIVETVPEVQARLSFFFRWFELFSIAVFTLEYLLRVWSCTAGGYSPIKGRLRFMVRPLLLIDLVAILPFYLQAFGLVLDLRVARMVRVARFVRIAKLGRYSPALQMLGRGFWSKKEELLMTLALGAFALILASTLIFFAENEAQPEVFSSIPAAFWWAITTLTTVGYGDAFPVTVGGKIFGGIFQVFGVLLLALPTGILASAFVQEMESARHEGAPHTGGAPHTCPHCGKIIEEA